MNRELAKDVVNILNSPAHFKVIDDFADTLIDQAKENLTGAPDYETVRHLQGMIAACKRFKKMRDDAVNVMKER